MLPAGDRLTRSVDIREVSRRGVRRSRAGLSVWAVHRPDRSDVRATVVVNKSVGGAVLRNRLRRQVRHGLARVWSEVPGGTDLVVRAGSKSAQLRAADLDAALSALVGPARADGAGRSR